jgi:hypothetical protein
MSYDISWCPVCDSGSLEDDPHMTACEECNLVFHLHCAINSDDCQENESGEVGGSHCPSCTGNWINPKYHHIFNGYCAALKNTRIDVLKDYLIAPLVSMKTKGVQLDLSSFKEIDLSAAKCLSNYRGPVYLDGLTSVPLEQLKLLGLIQDDLSLGSLKNISVEEAEVLCNHPGECFIMLGGLKELSPEVAKVFATHSKSVCLDGLEKYGEELANIFSYSNGTIQLEGVKTISVDVAEIISNSAGTFYFQSLDEISANSAKLLLKKGDYVITNLDLEKIANT